MQLLKHNTVYITDLNIFFMKHKRHFSLFTKHSYYKKTSFFTNINQVEKQMAKSQLKNEG